MVGKARIFGLIVLTAAAAILTAAAAAPESADTIVHDVQPGDTWTALSWRYGIEEEALRVANPHLNRQQEPAIGQTLPIPGSEHRESPGVIVTSNDGGLLQHAVAHGLNPWTISTMNGLVNPYRPLLYRPIFVPGGPNPPKQLPSGLRSLEVSRAPALPGQALAARGIKSKDTQLTARFAGKDFALASNENNFVALIGTGAFFEPGVYLLEVAVSGEPIWSQPWLVETGQWTFEEVNFSGQAAAIDAETIRRERERLAAIWTDNSGQPYWSTAFTEPLTDYLAYSSLYGARRSYSGGPYNRYHEGLDFSAYGGTPVYAPAAGNVSLAEILAARGGAVIIDHGLGLFSGYYHLSEVLVEPGAQVAPGVMIGRVGSTGLSTGNHLHWDLLVDGVWVDPAAWIDGDLDCWLLEGLGRSCASS